MRTPAVMVLLVGLLVGEGKTKIDINKERERTIAEIEAMGGLARADNRIRVYKVNLGRTKVTDALLLKLAGWTDVTFLSLEDTHVTDRGLKNLKGMTKLQYLEIDGTKVTDAGLAFLKGMTELTALDISNTNITDAGLTHLRGLSKLKILWLTKTKVTRKGVRELQKALPNAKIPWGPGQGSLIDTGRGTP